mmetsp:Transcript_25995/g.41969  ORF Transcript_25995/g.41969 Transcript_25995/m.41969 type:complete len:129 (-) Transcript_25995:19-405(-)
MSSVSRGRLVLKGGDPVVKPDKKRKRKHRKEKKSKHKKEKKELKSRDVVSNEAVDEDVDHSGSESDDGLRGLTAAERKFELAQRKKEKERIEKMVSKSHQEKIQEFNAKLSKLSDHNDLPNASSDGQG